MVCQLGMTLFINHHAMKHQCRHYYGLILLYYINESASDRGSSAFEKNRIRKENARVRE